MDFGSEDDTDVCSEQGLTKSTKKPPPKNTKQKTEPKTSKDDLCDEIVAFLKSKRNKSVDTDELFGQNIVVGLRNITDNKFKEYVKVKMQVFIFQVPFRFVTFAFFTECITQRFPSGPANNFQHIYHSASQHYPYQPQIKMFSVGQHFPSSSLNSSADNNS